MNYSKSLLVLLFVVSIVSTKALAQRASEESLKTIENIVGRWQLQKVYAGSREIPTNPNSESKSWIEFNPDATYVRNAEVNDQGSYRLNENHSILYLESSENTETSSATTVERLNEYDISIKDGILTMQAAGDDNSATKYVYVRSGEADN